ncbi:MAG: SDR family oxidoreductase [Pseudomonadales bacterium]|jgi:NAD(P)-dependent dehydrogenase (short-subunit alcohol dehydrogenase family)|nr:SDR family oxidoreductase [Pseudomonadales bacterium]MCP5320570.1 SDR family oxidoreductase [Pseudomonadales bacterium]MCP5336685.1 SDR family oxidoreductase [Pseudomonadales bacterium]
MSGKVAFITGASRGIGKATALALARKGYDVVVTARTLEEGEAWEHGSRDSEIKPMPGSLRATAAEIEAVGRRALPIRLDLLDLASIDAAVQRTYAEWGRIDLLVNNGIYQGPGIMSPISELTQKQLHDMFLGNVFANVHTIQRVLPHMLEAGSGCIVNVVSESGMMDPPAPAGKGGWGFAYSASKAALIRMAGVLKVEYAGTALQFFNMEPGLVMTEAMEMRPDREAFAELYGGAPMSVPAAVVVWLASAPEARELNGQTVMAQRHCRKLNLVPEWQPKRGTVSG